MMLVVEQESLLVRQAAGEIELRLGLEDWEGRPLNALIGSELSTQIAFLAMPGAEGGFKGQLKSHRGELLDVSGHFSTPYLIVELEPTSQTERPSSFLLDELASSAMGFERTSSLAALCTRAATEFRRLTGFDRVMIYRFLDDGAGRVVAEDRREGMHSFLNHHFPASDIPRQARALYLRNLVRVIPDASYQPVALRPPIKMSQPLDMSDSSLRSVSPVHLQYLANMGVNASASVSIVKDGVLWGLVACHNQTPRLLGYDIRAACRSLAGTLAQQIKAKEEAEGYRQRIRLRSFEDDIIALLSREGSLDEALSNHLDAIRRIMDADGVAILRANEMVVFGESPSEDHVRGLAEWLLSNPARPIFSTQTLPEVYPPAALFKNVGSGVLSIILSVEEPWLLIWFRAEQIETVRWAGNPHKLDALTPGEVLTPRASFEAWSETVDGRSARWTLGEIDGADRLRKALVDVQQNRQVRELNRQLNKSLAEKDLLLQQKEFLTGEVNHRVQNSLQLVSSFLSLQAGASKDPALLAALDEARRRVSAVALVHRRLYRGEHIGVVDAARYIEDLCAETFSFKGQDWAQHLTLNLSPVLVSTDRAVTLGLLLTELMINSSKHAYAGGEGPIEVELVEDRADLQLTVADKGGAKVANSKGFGSRMVAGLLTQVRGEIVYTDNQPGLRATLRMPVQPIPKN
jgi:chemotaxis family two-component system sensor kinase Cph1